MSNFKVFFLLAMKRFFCRRNLIIMFLIFSMSMYFVLTGINNYKNSKTNSIDFQKIESLKFERIRNYTHYSFHGVNVMFLSSPAGIFLYNPGSVADWSAKIDSVTGLEISRNLKGKGLFSEELPSLFHFPGLILYLVTLIVLFWGFETLRDKECIKFLSILSSYRNVFFYMILPGVILLSVTLLLLFSSLLGIVTLYGIPLSGSELSGLFKYYLATLSMLLVFYFSGAFIGARGSKSSGILPLISFWLIVVFLIPGAVTYWTAKQAEKITSNYHLELTKLDIVNNFENKAEKKAGKFDRNNIEAAREIAKEYYDQDYPQMEKQEELLKKEIFENIETHNILSLLTPTTFFQLTGKEVGSHGYQNAIAYYIYLLELKRDFVWFYFERTFFNNPKEMINFIKGDENIFRAKSLVPANYGAGLSVSVLWILVAAILAYFSFKRMLFPLPKSPEAFSTVDIRLNQGNSTGMSIDDTEVEGLIEQLINVFYGEFKEFPGKISIDDQDIVNKKKKDFMYITNPHQLPGQIKTGSFITITAGLANIPVQELKNELEEDDLKKRLKDIGNEKKSKILLKVAELKKCRLYIFNDFFLKIPGKSKHLLGNRIEALKNNGAAIVQLYSCINVYPKPDSMASFVFEKGKYIDLIGSRQ